MTATVHLLHGLPGCGKTHFAHQLAAAQRCVHLSHDEWVIRLCGRRPTAAQLDAVREPVHEMLWQYTARIVATGTDVILDFGFWTRAERDQARHRVRQAGAAHQLYRFACSEQLAWERVRQRNAAGARDSLYIDESTFRHFARCVEPVTADEAATVIADTGWFDHKPDAGQARAAP